MYNPLCDLCWGNVQLLSEQRPAVQTQSALKAPPLHYNLDIPKQVNTVGIHSDCHAHYTEVTGEDGGTVEKIMHKASCDEFKAICLDEEKLSDKIHKN